MKKRTVLLSALITSLFGITYLTTESSAENTDTKDATATFKLVAPTDTLKITEATDLTFLDAVISADDVVTTNSSDALVTIQELSGDAPGWELSAKLGDFVGATNGKTLTGAQIFFPSVTPTTTITGDTNAILPVANASDTAFEGTQKGKIITAGADAATIVTAVSGKGYGSWTMNYAQGDVQLKVPAGNLKETYSATLTYTLVDSPVTAN